VARSLAALHEGAARCRFALGMTALDFAIHCVQVLMYLRLRFAIA
jgi:hypothetical protein